MHCIQEPLLDWCTREIWLHLIFSDLCVPLIDAMGPRSMLMFQHNTPLKPDRIFH